jgi:hypothetical protein
MSAPEAAGTLVGRTGASFGELVPGIFSGSNVLLPSISTECRFTFAEDGKDLALASLLRKASVQPN